MEEKKLTVALACDHGGYALKEVLKAHLEAQGVSTKDFGCHSTESCDYPVFAQQAAQAVAEGKCRLGVVVCTTGIGVSIVANKVKGVRCALCHEPWSAPDDPPPQRRQHAGHRRRGHGAQLSQGDPGRLPVP